MSRRKNNQSTNNRQEVKNMEKEKIVGQVTLLEEESKEVKEESVEGLATKQKTIISAVVNGWNSTQCITSIKTRIESVEKSAFNIAMISCYTLGVTIPAYTDCKGLEHGEATIDKPIKKQAELLKLIGRSKATLSRWIKAMNLIIDNNYFNDFATGKYPFSYDKIIMIMDEKTKACFADYPLSDLMTMSVDTLESLTVLSGEEEKEEVKETKEEKEEEEKEESVETEEIQEEEKEETKEEEPETIPEVKIDFEYNGCKYQVNKTIFEKWLSENATIINE